MLVRDFRPAVLARDEIRDELHRARPVERHHRDHVLEARRLEPAQGIAHAPRFQLEDAERPRVREQRIGLGVVQRQRVEVDRHAPRVADQGHGVGEDGERAEAEEVHLEQAELLDRPHGEPGDQLRPLGVLVERNVLIERVVGDDDGGGVDRRVARTALQRPRDVPEFLHVRLGLDHLGEWRRLLVGVVERDVQRKRRDQLGDAVHVRVGHAQHAADVANGGLGAQRPERDDVSDPVVAVLLGDVPDDLVAAIVGEVDVHVGHRDPLRVEEALEQQAIPDRVDVRDAQAIRHQRAGRGAAARAHGDPSLARVVNEVPHDQEVAGEPHLLDDAKLVSEALLDGIARICPVAALEAIAGHVLEIALQRVVLGHDVSRQVEAPELERQIAALGDGQGVAARVRDLGEHPRHLVRRLDVELLGREAPALRIEERRAGLDAEQRFVSASVPRLEVVRVVGPGDRRADGLGELQRLRGHLRLLVEAVGLDLHEVVVLAEHLLVPAGCLAGAIVLTRRDQPRDFGVQTARQHEQTVGVLRQQLFVDARLVVEALEVGLGHELDQVLVTGEIADEDREVVGTFVAAVLPAPLLAPTRRHVQLAAHDGLDAPLLSRLVEVDGTEEVAVIGQRDGRELQLLRLGHQLLELGGAVQQRVLRVHVEMDEIAMLHASSSVTYSHSIVLGGFEETSNTTRLMPLTSLMIRFEMRPSRS